VTFFAQGVAVEAFPHQDALEIGVTLEMDAHQVPGFAFLEVGSWPYAGQAGQRGIFTRRLGFEHKGRATVKVVGVVDHFQVVGIALAQVIDGGGAGKIVEAQLVAYECGDFDKLGRIDDDTAVSLAVVAPDCACKMRF